MCILNIKKITAILLSAALTVFCLMLNAYAAAPEQDPVPGHNYYCELPLSLTTAGMPRYIKASFDYDRDFIDIVPDYPGYEDKGYIFPLAGSEYGELYDLNYTVDDTVITYEYTLKDGATLDDYLDILDKYRESSGLSKLSRAEDEMHSFPIFNCAMKEKVVVPPQVITYMYTVISVINTDGTVTYKDGERVGKCYYQSVRMPLPSLEPLATEATEPAGPWDAYKAVFEKQYNAKAGSFEVMYEHKSTNDEVDWALVSVKSVRNDTDWDNYLELGNRVMTRENGSYYPFTFDVGIYRSSDNKYYDLSSGDDKEYFPCLERVWDEIGTGRLIGDIDGDDELTVIDATMIQRCAVGLYDYPEDDLNPNFYEKSSVLYFSDFDRDNERDISDGTALLRYLTYLPYLNTAPNYGSEDDYDYELLSGGNAEITLYKGSGGEIIIPTTINGHKVTAIGYNAFDKLKSLTSVVIPDSVTSIGSGAFSDCTGLTEAVIGSSVTNIGWGAFSRCKSLGHITIPDSVTNIGSYAFYECTELKSIDIPDSVTSIGSNAFEGCSSLTDVTIGDSVEMIGECAFFNCPGVNKITIPASVTVIKQTALGYSYFDEKVSGFVISGYAGSEAERYANENGFKFVIIK